MNKPKKVFSYGGFRMVKKRYTKPLEQAVSQDVINKYVKQGAKLEINFFLKCLKEDFKYSTQLKEPEKKQNYIWSLIIVMQQRLKELE